jgi:hypothetical protein
MKFYSSRLFTKAISLQEAIDKSKAKPPVRSIDQMLADFDSKNKEAAQVKTAAKIEEPKLAPITVEVTAVKTDDMTKAAEMVSKGEATTLEEAKTKLEAPPKQAKKEAMVLKIAKSLDFRKFEPEEVVKAWGQHGTMDKCVANVKGKTNDPKTYCSLLALANKQSLERVKTSVKTEPKVTASKAEAMKPFFKKIAKLTAEEKSFLSKYFAKIYGQPFVDALLTNY